MACGGCTPPSACGLSPPVFLCHPINECLTYPNKRMLCVCLCRLRRQLSAVINFIRFKEDKDRLYNEAIARKQRLATAIDAAQVLYRQRERRRTDKTDTQNVCLKSLMNTHDGTREARMLMMFHSTIFSRLRMKAVYTLPPIPDAPGTTVFMS